MNIFLILCALVFGDWKDGGSWGDCDSLQGSSRVEDPPGTELVFTALRSWKPVESLGPAPRKARILAVEDPRTQECKGLRGSLTKPCPIFLI